MKIAEVMGTVVDALGAEWFNVKTALERSVGFHDDALHVIVGVLAQLVLAAALRSSVSRLAPWLIVLALELVNEWSDFRFDLWPEAERSAQVGEAVKDVLLTMALPTVLLILARKFPRLLGKGS
ncbi:MAG: hypothetical protein ABW194_01330 [Novosphingobium sp.]